MANPNRQRKLQQPRREAEDQARRRKLHRPRRKPKSQRKEETNGQRHQEDTKIENKESGSVVEKAGGNRGSCRVLQNTKRAEGPTGQEAFEG